MSSINFTENQFKVIDYGKENLLVSASAGSGKTTTMIERIIKIICEKGASIKNMLVSTFTNAAADAISEKLVDALRLKIHTLKKEIKVDKIEIERLEREIECLPNAAIGTLHSWCQSIIRKYFYETNDDPGFGIVEPTEYNLWIINAVNDVLEDELEIKNDKFMNVYKYFVYKRRNTRLSTAIIEIIYFLENVIDPFGYLDKALDCYDDTKYKDEYDTQIIDLETKITDDFIKLKSELDNNDVELKYSNKLIYQLEYYFANGVKEGTFVQKNHLNGCEDIKDKIAGNIKEYWELKNNTFDNEKCKCVAEVLCDLAKKALKKNNRKERRKGNSNI